MQAVIFSADLTDILVIQKNSLVRLPQREFIPGVDPKALIADQVLEDIGMRIPPQTWSMIGEGNDAVGVVCVYDIRKTMTLCKLPGEIVAVAHLFEVNRHDPERVGAGVPKAVDAAMRLCTDLGDTLTIDMPEPKVRTVSAMTPEFAAAAREAIWKILREQPDAKLIPIDNRAKAVMSLKV